MRETYGGSDSLGSILQSSQIGAGENVEKNDLLYLCGLSGKGHKVGITDYAAIGALTYGTAQTNAASGQIIAQTSLDASWTDFNAVRPPVVAKTDGNIFAVCCNSGGVGIKLNKLSVKGSLINSVVVAASGGSKSHAAFELSNGNIAVVYEIVSGTADIYIAIYDEFLVEVKAPTMVASSPAASYYFGATQLSVGGFAILYQDLSSPLLSKIAVFDNTGTATVAAFTVWTRTGSSQKQYHVLAELSNGDLAFAISSTNTVSGMGLNYGVFTTAGVQVLAATQLSAVSIATHPVMSVGVGYFAIARADGTDQKAWVINNAGAVQGSAFSSATTAGSPVAVVGCKIAVLSDGTDFYLIWHRSSDSKCVLTKLPIAGTGYVTTVITTSVTQYDFFVSAYYKDGYIVAASMSGTASNVSPTLWVVDVSRCRLIDVDGTSFGAVPGAQNSANLAIIDGKDRAFISSYSYNNVASTNLCAGKWASTVVLGVCVDSAAKNSSVAIASKSGAYKINSINGSPNKSFDMTSNAMIGSKGLIVAGGAVTFV